MDMVDPVRKRQTSAEKGASRKASRKEMSNDVTKRSHNVGRGIMVSAKDLDDLRPQLMAGALLTILRASGQSICVMAPVFKSWRVAALLIIALIAYVFSFRLAPLTILAAHSGTFFVFLLVETCFFFRTRKIHKRLQHIRPTNERPLPPSGSLDLFNRVSCVVDACASWKASRGIGRSADRWLQKWFLGTPVAELLRDNVEEMYAWAFFTREPAELDSEGRKLLDYFIEEHERRYDWKFKPGYDPQIKAIRINFDPLNVWYHPLSYYVPIWCLLSGARQYMRVLGFTYRYGNGEVPFFHNSPPESPGMLIEHGSAVPHTKRTPIVFIHGLGPGLAPYLIFLRRLAASHECFVIELPDISQAGVEKAPAFEEMADALAAMLEAHGHSQACFIAHSFGTFVLSWVSRWRPDIVAKAIFLDPVCFLLSQPDVAFNVLYRQPRNWFTMLAANTVFWELFTANSLQRNFIWYNNVLWLDELPKNAIVALSSMDDIANSRAVRCYIEDHQRQSEGSDNDLKLLWFDGFFHGELFLHKSAQLQIMEFI